MVTSPNEAVLDEFLTRAVAEVVVRESLARALRTGERRLRIKQGFDPTRPNLHLGHVVGLRKLKQLAEWGHEIILIIGDYTTQIGDPTDKDETRPMMSHEQVLANAETYLQQFHRIVPRENTRVVYQTEWFGKFSLKDTIVLASRFTVQQMLAREEYRKRLASQTPIPLKDMLYPLLQAYDSLAIDADVEVGGTDQKFNCLVGRDLQEQLGKRPQDVFMVQLLEGTDGEKMSKSKPATGIWLTDTPDEMFGKVMSIADPLMAHYFEWGTNLPLDVVRATLSAVETRALHPREAKERLARAIVAELHTPAAADEAAAEFSRRFKDKAAPSEIPQVGLERGARGKVSVVELLREAGFAKSNGEARRYLEQGGVKLDGTVAVVGTELPTSGTVLVQVGPRRFARVTWR